MITRITTARALGLRNVGRVISYRLRLRAGIHPVQWIKAGAPPQGPYFVAAAAPGLLPAPRAWLTTANYFGWYRPVLTGGPPDWHSNVITGARAKRTDADWWTLPDFDPAVGDIKTIWEASRFDWVVNFALQERAGMPGSGERLNRWLADWCARNPPHRGHNWKCAQEASIRVLHLAVAALVLSETLTPLPGLIELLVVHLRRIEPTVSYAMAQDNNHGTSEAAALFIAGSWLERLGWAEAPRWHGQGRALLENRIQRLVEPDGSFSQYSVNYHRLMLDTVSLVEVWRRHLMQPPFSTLYSSRVAAASAWMRALVDPESGDAPNYGANDGANLLPLTDADCRDYRPAVQLASALFESCAAYPGGPWQAQLEWLKVPPGPGRPAAIHPAMFDDGGVAVLVLGNARAMLRYPRFRFRPSHADALHIDLSVAGENVLRDGGSFSYAAETDWQDYFAGARGHNTVQFDNRDQMTRLGRFLWGPWLTTKTRERATVTDAGQTTGASYRDAWGAVHGRAVELVPGRLTVTDEVRGFRSRAVLRWRLRPGTWILRGTTASDGHHRLEVSADVPIVRCEIVDGWESRYYMQKTPIPVLEVEVASPGTVTSRYRWDG